MSEKKCEHCGGDIVWDKGLIVKITNRKNKELKICLSCLERLVKVSDLLKEEN